MRLPLTIRRLLTCVLVVAVGGCAHPTARRGAAGQSGPDPRPRLIIDWLGNGEVDPYHCAVLDGARRAAQQAGVDLVVENPPGLTWRQQNAEVEQAVGSRANAIVLDPVAYPRSEMVVRGAHDQEEHVVLVDTPPTPNPGLAWAFVATDEGALERSATAELSSLTAGRPQQTLLVRSSTMVTSSSRAGAQPSSREIFLDLAGPTGATDVAPLTRVLRSHPGITGIFVSDPTLVAPVLEARSSQGRTVPVVAAGAGPDEVSQLRTGRLAALVVMPGRRVGQIAVQDAVAAATSTVVPDQVVPPLLVTASTLQGADPGCGAG